VSLLRAVLILCSVLVLSACGSSSKSSQPAATEPQSKVPPAIEKIDEAAAVPVLTATEFCQGSDGRCQPSPDEAERLSNAMAPANGATAKGIAELPLSARGPNARARLIAWKGRSGDLCLETEVQDGNVASLRHASGPCVRTDCKRLCVSVVGTGTSGAPQLLSGVVDSKADELRVTYDDGRVVPYGLTGPLVPGFPGYRVFMLDLGRSLYQRLELRLSDKDLAEETLSRAQIQLLRCGEQTPPALPGQAGSGRSSGLHDCIQRAAPK
jgi:hypothetical protein